MKKQRDYAWLLALIILLIAILAASCQPRSGKFVENQYLQNLRKDSLLYQQRYYQWRFNSEMYNYEKLNRFFVGDTYQSKAIVHVDLPEEWQAIEVEPSELIGYRRGDTLYIAFKPSK